MAAGDWTQESDSVDLVMNQVLAAEREARDAVVLCHAEAAQILAAAEEGARRIAHRTEHRIGLVHRVADQAVDRTLHQLRAGGPESGSALSEEDVSELLDRAVDALVDELLDPEP